MMRTAYGPRERHGISFENDVPRTKQSFKAECDINNILLKYQRTGAIDHVRRFGGEYDYAHALDFKEAMDIVARGNSMFEALPSSLRKRFQTPEAFLEFVQDEANIEEARKLGLARPKAVDEPPAQPVVDSPTEPKATEGDGDSN